MEADFDPFLDYEITVEKRLDEKDAAGNVQYEAPVKFMVSKDSDYVTKGGSERPGGTKTKGPQRKVLIIGNPDLPHSIGTKVTMADGEAVYVTESELLDDGGVPSHVEMTCLSEERNS